MPTKLARWAPGSGIVFAALVIVATIVTSGGPARHASDASWTSYYADSGHRHGEQIAFILVGLAGIFFLWFLGCLRQVLANAERQGTRLTTTAVASGAVFISLALLAHAVGSAISWTRSYFGDSFSIDPQTARLLAGLSFSCFAMGMFAAAAMALATTILSFRTRVFPVWLSAIGALAVLGALLAITGFVSLLTLAWIVLVSGWLLTRQPAPGAMPAT